MITIRKTLLQDFEAYEELYTNLDYSYNLIGEKQKDRYMLQTRGYLDSTVTLTKEEFEERLETEICFSLLEDDQLIGYAEIIPKNETTWHIDELGIRDDKQHQGLGKYFLAEISKVAKKQGVNLLTLTCFAKGSIAFFKKQEFECVGKNTFQKKL